MKVTTVTFSGGSNNNDINRMVQMGVENPFVEWGIQTPHYGGGIFPSAEWARQFVDAASEAGVKTSAHLCHVRGLLSGENWIEENIAGWQKWDRFQVNTHGFSYNGQIDEKAFDTMKRHSDLGQEFIIQIDEVNQELLERATNDDGINASGFFDTSMGAGIQPSVWPDWRQYAASPSTRWGYSGGLGPGTIVTQLGAIEKSAGNIDIWVDMEGRIRGMGGMSLDKCQQVIDEVKNSTFLV